MSDPMKEVCSKQCSDTSHQEMKAVHTILLFLALAGTATSQVVKKNFFVNILYNWGDAQKYCQAFFADLSTINTTWDFFKFKKDVGVNVADQGWVGLRKRPNEFLYTHWSDGGLLGVTLWKFGAPTYATNYHCVEIKNMELADNDCTRLQPFFCYKWVPQMVLVHEMLTWDEALDYCRRYYFDLISVFDDNELKVAKSISNSSQTPRVWTGLRFMGGLWFWVNNDPLMDMKWMPSCPIRPYHCGALKAGDVVWENRDCNEKMNFLCSS